MNPNPDPFNLILDPRPCWKDNLLPQIINVIILKLIKIKNDVYVFSHLFDKYDNTDHSGSWGSDLDLVISRSSVGLDPQQSWKLVVYSKHFPLYTPERISYLSTQITQILICHTVSCFH